MKGRYRKNGGKRKIEKIKINWRLKDKIKMQKRRARDRNAPTKRNNKAKL